MTVTRFLPLALLLCVPVLAEDIYTVPDGVVGVPYSFNYGQGFENLPPGTFDGIEFGYSFTTTAGTLPPGLALAPNGLLSGVPIAAGTFNFTIQLKFTIKFDGQDYCALIGQQLCITDIPSTVRITGGDPDKPFVILPDTISFTGPQGGSSPPSQSITLSNRTSQPRTYTAEIVYLSGSNWLRPSNTTGTIAAYSDGSISLGVATTGLQAGSYRARVVVTPSGGQSVTVLVTLTITSGQPSIILSQKGLFFSAIQNGSGVPSQTVTVLSSTSAALTYTATPLTFSGGTGWLTAGVNGSSLNVAVNPGTLAPGDYYGQVSIAAQGVTNSPQTIAVVMHVDPSTTIGASIKPSGMIFVGRPGGSNPAAQTITISNYGRAAFRAGAAINYLGGTKTFLTAAPSTLSVNAGASGTITVTPNISGLTTGIYRAEIAVPVEGVVESVHRIDVLLIVAPGAGPAAQKEGEVSAAGCTPTKLLPVFTVLGSGFKVNVGWPTPIEVRVVDDCGDPLTTGTVSASFSNGDPALSLQSLRDGRWTATWQARGSVAGVAVTAKAALESPKLDGTAQIGGQTAANPSVPVIGATVSAASFEKEAPIAPGAFVALFGSKVGGVLSVAPALPLKTELDGIQVIVGGRPIPLYFTSEGQINAIVPYDMPVNTTQQVLVRKGSTLSVPESVNVAIAQPALFTLDQTGKGGGIVVAYRGDRSWIVKPGEPVREGDTLVIYCTGLGPVSGNVVAGTAAPGLSGDAVAVTSNPVSVTIGGRVAAVAFAGLTPGFAGLYQINTTVPAGVASGNAELIITVSGIASPAGATIAIE